MIKGNNLEDRLVNFAVRIIRLCDAMPSTPSARHIRNQILRSGTSPAPNYGEARSAESRKDFIHKLKIGLKEMNETRIWLKILIQTQIVNPDVLGSLLDECEQLCRILSSSVNTVRNLADSMN